MKRNLTEHEITYVLDFIQENQYIPSKIAKQICENNKNRLIKQLTNIQIYPELIDKLKEEIKNYYKKSLIHAGESVGVLCAQSIGEKQTQGMLNSIDWTEEILFSLNNNVCIEPIGKFIDNLIKLNIEKVQYIEENRTEYLPLCEDYKIPSTDENGFVKWYKIEAVTKHLPIGKLVKVVTESGRSVMATQAKSFLVWNGSKFIDTLGSDIKVGDILPTTNTLHRPVIITTFDVSSVLPKTEYLYTTEVNKAIKYHKTNGGLTTRTSNVFTTLNGKEFTVPYKRYDIMLGKRKNYLENCPDGLVYIHTSNELVSHFPDKITLDNDFGFFVGIYLAEGLCTKTYISISNACPIIRKRITDYCDKFGFTYHLVVSSNKNVEGTSTDLKIHSTLLARLFKILCETGSLNKFVPLFAYNAPDCFIKGLVDGYFSGDGTVSKEDGSVIASSISQNLLWGISTLLNYYEIFSKMSSSPPRKDSVFNKTHTLYKIRISNLNAQEFAKNFSLTEEKKEWRLQNITLQKEYKYQLGLNQEKFPIRDVYFDRVKTVEYVDGTTEFVYDLTVEETRNFQVRNGLSVKDTFHKAGMSEKTMTSGVPRFQELINATKKPKIVNNKIYIKNGENKSLEETKEIVGSNIACIYLKDIVTSFKISENSDREPWYDVFDIIYNTKYKDHKHCVKFKLNLEKLFNFKLTLKKISNNIEKEYPDVFCVFSPLGSGELHIYPDVSTIKLPDGQTSFITEENKELMYIEECVIPALENICVAGIEGISEIFYVKEKNNWIVETNGVNSRNISLTFINYKKLLALPFIDFSKTLSNNVWDILDVLGIEAARNALIDEFMNIMEGINVCHAVLLVERMTFAGSISSITRYTMKKDENGPFGKASFEETMDNFLNAAAKGEIEPTESVSASIVCGKRACIGTGLSNLKINLDLLENI